MALLFHWVLLCKIFASCNKSTLATFKKILRCPLSLRVNAYFLIVKGMHKKMFFALTMFIICKNQLKDIPDLTYFHIFFKSCVSYMVGILEYQGLERVWYFSSSVLKNQVTKWDQIKGRPPQLLTGQHFFVFLLLLIEVELLLEKFLQTDLYEKLIKC